jgi:hypothetical protein
MNNGTENNLAKKIKFVKGMGSFGEKMVMAVLSSASTPQDSHLKGLSVQSQAETWQNEPSTLQLVDTPGIEVGMSSQLVSKLSST